MSIEFAVDNPIALLHHSAVGPLDEEIIKNGDEEKDGHNNFDEQNEMREEKESSIVVAVCKYGSSFVLGVVALILYFAVHKANVDTTSPGMGFLILVLTIPSTIFASADGYGYANDMVKEQYGGKRAIQVNVGTGNGTELITAIMAFAIRPADPALAFNVVFSGMIINGLFVPSLSVLAALFIAKKGEVKNDEHPNPNEDYLQLQIFQTIGVGIIIFFMKSSEISYDFTATNYIFYAWALYSYLMKVYVNVMECEDDENFTATKTPWTISAYYLVFTFWIVIMQYIGTTCVPLAAEFVGITQGFFSVIFALEGAIPELYKSIIECMEMGTFEVPRAVSTESNAQLCGFVLPFIAIVGSNAILGQSQANIKLDFLTCAFYCLSTFMCAYNSRMAVISVEAATVTFMLGVLYLEVAHVLGVFVAFIQPKQFNLALRR